MAALALVSDLVMQSQMAGASTRAAVQLKTVGSAEALLAEAEATRPALVLLDLSHPGVDPGALVERIKSLSPETTIVAFGPHVHKELLAAAEAAGCDQVISRGQFHAQIVEILQAFGG